MTFRLAAAADLPELRNLDAACFPPGDPEHQQAAAGELEAGTRNGTITLAMIADRMVGYFASDRPSQSHIYISALAVHPDQRRSGIAGQLLDRFLRSMSTDDLLVTSISTVTSPNNLPMLRLLCSRSFIVRSRVSDYFGPGKDRFYCQLKTRHIFADPDDRYLVPVESGESLTRLLDNEAYVITDVLAMAWGAYMYEVSRFDVDDISSLQSDECSASISFQTAILGVLTFLLAFSFTSASYPVGARGLLVVATLASTISLIVYANASGDLSRLQNGEFEQHMKWGNLLSEFGGVQPFVVVLALTFANVTTGDVADVVIGAGTALAMLAYEFSPFSYRDRYKGDFKYTASAIACCLLPLIGVFTLDSTWQMWTWTGVALSLFALRIVFYWPRSHAEAASTALHGPWRSRRT